MLAFDPCLNTLVAQPGLMLSCTNIAEMLEQVEMETGAYVVPHDPPKYFRYHLSRSDPNFVLVDIHVTRDGKEICVKQDISFPLLPSDKVMFGHLAC
ncbi:hypothetical protein [Variovorax paradoxus]|uniref:hypothetical protein n=1 Tax=Variovorax paradoxus TaxID=34073 RepID=UPI0030D36080